MLRTLLTLGLLLAVSCAQQLSRFPQQQLPRPLGAVGSFSSAPQPARSFNAAPQPARSFNAAPQPVRSFNAAPQPGRSFNAAPQPALRAAVQPGRSFTAAARGRPPAVAAADQLRTAQPLVRTAQFGQGQHVPIVRSSRRQELDGAFQWAYESADGQRAAAEGEQRRVGDGVGTVMRGEYAYTTPEGQTVQVSWVADENGFQPTTTYL